MPIMQCGGQPKNRQIFVNDCSFIKILLLSPALLLGGCFGQGTAANAPQPAFVQAALAAPDQLAADAVTGVVESESPMVAGTTTGGRVISVNVQIGQPVRQGQVLAVLDGKAASLRAAQADAEVRRAAALAHDRTANAARVQQMAQGGSLSEAERSAAAAEAGAATAALAAARAAAAAAHEEASQSRILSPGNGIVARRSVELGSVVTPGQALFTIDQGKGSMILAAVPQRLAATLAPDRIVTFAGSGQTGRARVVGISPKVEDGGVVPVRLAIVEGEVATGSVVTVALGGAQSDAPTGATRIPVGAMLTARDGSRYVYVIEDARSGRRKTLKRVPVQLVGISGGDARVRAPGLAGKQIVSAGGAFLQSGQHVQIVKPGT